LYFLSTTPYYRSQVARNNNWLSNIATPENKSFYRNTMPLSHTAKYSIPERTFNVTQQQNPEIANGR